MDKAINKNKLGRFSESLVLFRQKAKLPFLTSLAVGIFALGFLSGARHFENGHSGPVKGSNVKITGLCRVMGDVRYPPLQEAEVKITDYDLKSNIIAGVMRETAEPVECDIKSITIDTLPLFSDFLTSPRPLTLSKPGERITKPKEVKAAYPHLNSEVWITGFCYNENGEKETLFNKHSEITKAKEIGDEWELNVLVKDRKEMYTCKSGDLSVKEADPEAKGPVPEMLVNTPNYINKTILVTGDCVPYKSPYEKNGDSEERRMFIPLTDSPIKIRTNVFVKGKLAKFTGMAIMMDGTPLVECDTIKNTDITYREYDPSTQRLIKAGNK